MKSLLVIILSCFTLTLVAQSNDTLSPTKKEIRKQEKLIRMRKDSASRKPIDAPKRPFSVKNATLFSTFLPGAGQIYNHRAKRYFNQFRAVEDRQKVHAWWKVPLIYTGLGVSGYYIYENNRQVKELRTEYNRRIDNGISFDDPKYAQYDNTAILTIHDQYQNWRDISIMAFSLIYLLNIIDAAVEGHFVNFDISDNLSMNIQPTYMAQTNAFGLGVRFNFK